MTAGIPLKNQQLISQLYVKPNKEKITPSYINSILVPNYLHQADVLYLPEDPSGYKYLLTVIDVHNSLCGAFPLKNMTAPTIIDGLENIYKLRLLSFPTILQVDNQFDNQSINTWAKRRNVRLKFIVPHRHRQNAHVERLNQEFGEIFFKIMLDKEITNGVRNTEWVRYYRDVVDYHNNKILPRLPPDRKKPIRNPNDIEIKFNRNSNYIIKSGTVVRRLLDAPVEYLGNRLQGKFRKTDIRWSKDFYRVIDVITVPRNPPLYQIMNITENKLVRALFTNEQLQIVPRNSLPNNI
jgi:hypothetical protein